MAQDTLSPRVRLAADQARDQARETVRDASPGLIWLGRIGMAAKGAVYVLIGIIAARVALGTGEQTTDTQGVLGRIEAMPFGTLLLAVVALGLVGYATWRTVQALLDTEYKGTDLKGLWVRGAYLTSSVIHALLALTAVRMLLNSGQSSGSGEGAAQDWTARLLEQPFGPWLVALVGVCLIGSGGFQVVRAVTAKFQEELHTTRMSQQERALAIWAGRAGHLARGVTFGVMGLFLMLAALRHEPGEAKGLAGALNTLAEQPFGPLLLGTVAIGLALYGLYMFVEAWYRRMIIRGGASS